VIFLETSFGLGYMISSLFSPFGGTGSFGHPGAVDRSACDPDNNLAIGYVMNA